MIATQMSRFPSHLLLLFLSIIHVQHCNSECTDNGFGVVVCIYTDSPTKKPTLSPTPSPTLAPTTSPSASPTTCVDYDSSYNSNDGIDIVRHDYLDYIPTVSDYSSSNTLIVYNSTSVDTLIACNDTSADVCFIDCHSVSSCFYAIVSPEIGTSLQHLIITCVERKSCKGMNINVTDSNVEDVQLFCDESTSCQDVTLRIDAMVSSLSIYCNESRSCQDMLVHLVGDHINNTINTSSSNNRNDSQHSLLAVQISCFGDNSCDRMTITTDHSKNIELTLNVSRWSESISIYHLYADNVNVHCGSTDDHRYIRYETDAFLSDDEILDIARSEYSNYRLPCEDVTIYCSNNTDFDYQCTFEYDLDIDFDSILNDSDSADSAMCYWLDLGAVYLADCEGTCGDAMVYNEYPILFDLDIVFDEGKEYNDSNETVSFLKCNEYFGSTNDTVSSLQSVDVLFEYVLTQIAEYSNLIHSVSIGPHSMLRNGSYVYCQNVDINVIEISTNLTILSIEENEDEIEALFVANSVFMNSSTEILSDFFGIPVNLIIDLLESNILDGFSTFELVLMGGGVFVFCTLVICLSVYIRRRILESKTMYIRNAMVIPIGIGEYDLSLKAKKTNQFLTDLSDGIRNDIENMTQFFGEELKYAVYPHDQSCTAHKVRWTRHELLQFLNKMAVNLQHNLLSADTPFDGLVVSVSCHGMKDRIWTTDYQTISKQSIHRIFSSLPINRTIPRIFVFDSCAGNQRRDRDSRSVIEKNRTESGGDSHIETGIDESDTMISRETTRLQHMDHVMQSRDEENPDHQLVQIDAANPDFQAQMSQKFQESYLTHLLIKGLSLRSNKFLFQIMGEVQRSLYEKGIQLIEHRYNNGTEYIKFVEGETPSDSGARHVVFSSDSEGADTVSVRQGIVQKQVIGFEARDIVNNGLAKQDSAVLSAVTEMVEKVRNGK